MGKWNEFAQDLRRRLPREHTIEMSVSEIIRVTGSTDKAIRQPDWWRLIARGADERRDTLSCACSERAAGSGLSFA